jgi:hypothetical protein
MMQTADLRERDDLAGTEWVYRAAASVDPVISPPTLIRRSAYRENPASREVVEYLQVDAQN